jgi:hypothetical protein
MDGHAIIDARTAGGRRVDIRDAHRNHAGHPRDNIYDCFDQAPASCSTFKSMNQSGDGNFATSIRLLFDLPSVTEPPAIHALPLSAVDREGWSPMTAVRRGIPGSVK